MKVSLICIIILFAGAAYAQPVTGRQNNDGPDDHYEAKTYFFCGANYLSNNVYLGRKDTVVTPYISPYLGYHFKSGLYGKTQLSYSPRKKTLDLLTLEAGYEHTFGDHLNTGVNADKFFYNKNTNTIRGNTKGSAGIFGQYENDWLQPTICLDANFNRKTDYVLGLGLDHNFAMRNRTLNIIPAITMNAGTQHYYEEYFLNKLTKKDKTLKQSKALADAGRFRPLDYELSTNITYRVTKWLFTLNATYAIPVNPNTIIFPKQTFTEKLSNTFYFELDICHR